MAADERITFAPPIRRPREGHRKVIPWPAMNAAVGFAGLARVADGRWTDEALENLMHGRAWRSLEEFARALEHELPRFVPATLHDHRATLKGPDDVPTFWYVRNTEWSVITPRTFRTDEDLRDTILAGLAPWLHPHLWVSRWSGRHDAYSRRAHDALNHEGARSLNLEGLAAWARKEIVRVRREIATLIREEREVAEQRGQTSGPWRTASPMNVGPTTRAVVIRPKGITEIPRRGSEP